MWRILFCVGGFGTAGYMLQRWLLSFEVDEAFDGIWLSLLLMMVGPVPFGVVGLLLGYLWDLRKRAALAHGISQMLTSTFLHLARVDGPPNDAEVRFVRQATLDVCRRWLGFAWFFSDDRILDEEALQRQCLADKNDESELDTFARRTFIDVLERCDPAFGRYFLQMAVSLAAVDQPINREELQWLEAVVVVAKLQDDLRAQAMLAPLYQRRSALA